jgi:hypothetical protein
MRLRLPEPVLFVLNLLKQDDGVDRARTFLNWFRELRIARSVATHVRWLLCGSIGLDTVTARLGFGDAINDLFIVHLGAFDEPTADGFLSALADSYDVELGEATRAHALQRVGWLIPYHLQVLFAALRENDRRPVDEAAIDAAYEALLAPVHKGYFDFWQQRLHEELGQPDDGHALALLNAVARDPDGASDEVLRGVLAARIGGDPAQTLRYLRDVLENDGYLVRDGDRWRFRSNLLRDYWCRRVLP